MKVFGIELIPWQVTLLQQWGLLPSRHRAGQNVDDRTKRGIEDMPNIPPAIVFDGSENDPYRQYPPPIPQEAWDAAINGEPAQHGPKAVTYPLDLPPEFVPRESPLLTPPYDGATTQRALDYIKSGYGEPYKWPGYDSVYEPPRGLLQFQPGTFDKLDKLLQGEPMTTTMAELPVDIQEANLANLRKRNRNQRTALRQLNKSIIDKLYRINLLEFDKRILKSQVGTLNRRIEDMGRMHDMCDAARTAEVERLEDQVRKLKARNKKLRRKLGRLNGK